jgi:hypothetical protein
VQSEIVWDIDFVRADAEPDVGILGTSTAPSISENAALLLNCVA